MTNTAPGPDARRIQDTITAYWDYRAPSYDSDPGHYAEGDEYLAWRDDLAALLPPPPAEVLDIGSGTGFMSILLARMGYSVTGIDPAEGMLCAARARAAGIKPAPVFREGDGHAPPLPEASVDIIVNRHVLWTLHDPARAFAAWLRILRPGGTLLAVDSLWFLDRGNDPANPQASYADAWRTHYNDTVRAQLPLMNADDLAPALDLLRSAGFTDARMERLTRAEAYDRARATDGNPPLPRYALIARRPTE